MKKTKAAKPNGQATEEYDTISKSPEQLSGVELSPAERKKLFKAYDAKSKEVDKARRELDHLLAQRSQIVSEIATSCGRGPFIYEGQYLTAVARTNKETGEQTWFFKGPDKTKGIEV